LSAETVFSTQAPAKINRELRVGAVRSDGYHEIRSRIVSIDLADSLAVAPGDGALALTSEGIPVPRGESNLIVRAARALAERLGRSADARITLTKRIPVGAGLGGGSSDAAATLRLLSRAWGAELPGAELHAIAASLGSDVPFFLTGGEADVSGRGEIVRAAPDSPAVDLLLLVPPFAISTRAAYAAYRRSASAKPVAPVPTSLFIETSGKFFGPNDLAFPVLQERPEMSVLLDSARSVASEAAISGSGSTIVVRGASPEAVSTLRSRHPEARLVPCRTLSFSEYRVRTESSGGSQWRSLK
jgi:4-diphosphocytidyl-2-C-methyl-D-erythritol kinase